MLINNFAKKILAHLRGKQRLDKDFKLFHHYELVFKKTIIAVHIFYMLSFFLALVNSSWMWPMLKQTVFQEPLWPFFGANENQVATLLPVLMLLWIIGSLLAAINPWRMSYRLMQALGTFYLVGLINSDGHFGHNRHAFMWVSMFFVLLPDLRNKKLNRRDKSRLINTFWGAQFVISTFYLMTGLWKVISIGECIVTRDLVCELGPKILTNISAREFIEYKQFAPIRFILFDYPWLGFFSYMGTIWIHLFSIHFLFRTDISDLYGVLRVIFHLGTFLLFGVDFTAMTAAIVVIFLLSPFAKRDQPIIEKLTRLPLLGIIFYPALDFIDRRNGG